MASQPSQSLAQVPWTRGPSWQELRPTGVGTAWVCTIGRRAVHGDLAAFITALGEPHFGPDSLMYRTPTGTDLRLTWDGPFTVNGRPADLPTAPLLTNPYTPLASGEDDLPPHVIDPTTMINKRARTRAGPGHQRGGTRHQPPPPADPRS
jgi:hypothetical protein